MNVKVEVSVTGIAQAWRAVELGADHVELCTWPECGGVTPSAGMVQVAFERITAAPRILLRPTPGGFRYAGSDVQAAVRDLELFADRHPGCHIVTGALDADDMPDQAWMARMRNAGPGCRFTFHRAVDVAARFEEACERLFTLGVDRILTSGGADHALAGARAIAHAVQHAPAHITIAAAGKVDAINVVPLVERTGVEEVHFAITVPPAVALRPGLDGGQVDEAKLVGVLEALAKAGLR